MTNIEKILGGLTPEKRRLLEKKIKEEGSKFGVFPLSYAQQRLWFLEQLQPGNTAYNIPAVIKLTGGLNFTALKNSLSQIVQRHEVLRTYISTIDETPMQIVEKQLDVLINKVDLTNIEDSSVQNAKLNEVIKSEIAKPFNFSKLPLFRVTIVQIKKNENILILIMHHIISDGWSAGIFINELSQLYLTNSKGIDYKLPSLEIQYADFAKWQRKWLQGKVKDEQLNYWKEQLENVPVLELPTDFSRPKVQSYNGGLVKGKLDKDIANKLKRISKEKGATLFMSLLSAFNILLYKYSGQEDFAVGTPIANRSKSQIENLIGFFVNTLALRASINPNYTFIEYLENFREKTLTAFTNQDLPFEMLIEELQPERDMSYTPIFQVMFTFQGNTKAELKLDNIKLEPVELEATIAKFDLSLNITETKNENLLIGFEYNKDIFSEQTVNIIKNSFVKIIKDIIKKPSVKIKDISHLDNRQAETILFDWNKTEIKYPFEKTILDYFSDQVKNNPESIALEFEDKKLTYSELDKKTNQLSRYFTSKAKTEGEIVALLLDRSFEMVISIIAVLKAGAAYLPIDPSQPDERINYTLSDAKVKIVLTHKHYDEKLKETNVTTILIDSEEEKINRENYTNVTFPIYPESLAYCIYTSGSTGKPKGTLLHHKGLLNRILWMKDEIKATGNDIFIQKTPYTFDVSVWEFFLPLIIGAKLVIAKSEGHKDPFYLEKIIKEKEVSIIHFVPSMLKVFLDTPNIQSCTSLNNVICSGEALTGKVQNKFFSLFNCNLYNFYGPTEATVDVTYWKCSRESAHQNIPIGKPITNTQVYVLDNFLNPVPVGVPGELFIGGVNLAYGYLNKPDLTAQKFIPNPFAKKEGERIYRTGDLVKYLPNGNIVFLNRIDFQVKLRGLRIELGEIESVIKELNFIKDAFVKVYSDENKNENLIAYIISDEKNGNAKTDLIKNHLEKSLPEYMIPTFFIYLEEFPLTTSGKTDRKKLPEPDKNVTDKKEIIEPTTDTEKLLVEIIGELLNKKNISIADNFFNIGGHSLLATQLLIRLKKKLAIDIPLKNIFEQPVIKDFAKSIDEISNTGKNNEEIKIGKVKREGKLQLSYQQQRLWFLDQMDPMNASYNIPIAVKLKGRFNKSFAEEAVNEIIKRHEILRSYIQTINGEPEIKIVDEYKYVLETIEVDNDELNRFIKENFSKPFELSKHPLFRIKLLKLNDDEYFLLFVIHHIISDGWSGGIFIKEFSEIYNSLTKNKKYNLENLEIQYVDFAAWQRNYLEKTLFSNQLKFWKDYLSGIPSKLDLALDKKRPAVQTFNGSSLKFKLSKELSEKILELSRNESVTPFMILISAYNILLSKYSHQNDICIGTPVANRNHQALENLIGFFVNTVVIRSKINGNQTISNFLKSIKDSSLSAFSNQDIPFEKIVDALDIERSVSHSPVFQVMFTFQNLPETKIELPDLTLEAVEPDSDISKFDLSLTMTEGKGNQLIGNLEFNTDLFYSSTIERMLEHFENILTEITSAPQKKINDIQILSSEEKKILLLDWNKTNYEYPQTLLHKLFENKVNEHPDRIAVVFENERITYKELNKKANVIAKYLIDNSITTESVIGIYMQPSIDMIIAMMAILKAGAAYLPLDPKYPDNRIQHMVEDSNTKIILTQNSLIQKLEQFGKTLYSVDKNIIFEEENISEEINIKLSSENLAYVIYTSGSTGKPKGVACSHKGVINHIYDFIKRKPQITERKGSLWTSPNFDVSVYEIFHTLCLGGELHIIHEEIRSNGDELFNWLSLNKITNAYLPPFLLEDFGNWLLEHPNQSQLKVLLVGVEPIKKSTLSKINKLIPDVLIVNGYGPTETTINSTAYELTEETESDEITPIGKPIINTQIYLLDEELTPVPIGVPGELCISTEAIARGYLNNPTLTAEKFIPNPFSKKRGERLYKTGDLAKYLPDGNIEFIGRVDNQVKLRGFRIELSEIDSLLNKHKDIKQSVVIIRKDKSGVQKLVAYYVSDNTNLKNEDLEKYLSENLPEYMIPNFFVKLKEIPLTPNGKIDRKALPEPTVGDTTSTEEFIEPQTEKEIILSNVWKEVLGFDKIGIKDNFFKLGGDSIVAIQMIAKAKQQGLKITPVQIFQNQTLQKLALVAKEVEIISAEQGIVEGIAPLTPIQNYFFENDFQKPNHWNQSIFLKVKEVLDEIKLKEAVGKLISHHDQLRAKFEKINNNWQQIILPHSEGIPFEVINLTGTAKDKIKNIIEDSNLKTQASLNFETGEVIKVVYYKLNESESRILIVVHHLVIDGVSWRILIEDLITAYNLLVNDKEIILPPKTTSYKEWAIFINDYAKSNQFKTEMEFWLELTKKEVPLLEKDFDSNDNFEDSLFTKSLSLTLDETNYLLTDIHERYNTKINDILLSAVLIAFNKWQGKRRLLLHMEGHGREDISNNIDVSRTIGWFTSLFPVLLEMSDAIEIGEIIKLVKESLRKIPQKGIGFGIFRYLIENKEMQNRLKKFDNVQLMFNYLGQFDQSVPENSPFTMAEEHKGTERALVNKRTSLIDVTTVVSQGLMRINISASKNQFNQNNISDFLDKIKISLQEIIAYCKNDSQIEYTSSDFDLIDLEDDQLSSVLNKLNNEDD